MKINDLNVCLDVLIQAVGIAQKQGAYTIKESAYISAAIDYLEELSGVKLNEDETTTETTSDDVDE